MREGKIADTKFVNKNELINKFWFILFENKYIPRKIIVKSSTEMIAELKNMTTLNTNREIATIIS